MYSFKSKLKLKGKTQHMLNDQHDKVKTTHFWAANIAMSCSIRLVCLLSEPC